MGGNGGCRDDASRILDRPNVIGSEPPSPRLRLGIALLAVACLAGGCVTARLRAEFTRGDYALLTSPAMHVVICGSGGALTDAERAGPCTAVVAGGRVFLVDVGPGAWKGYDLAGLPLDGLSAVLFTTFLADDVADFDEALIRSWIAGRPRRLDVYGPPGAARIVADVDDALALDVAIRRQRHDPTVLVPELVGADAHEFQLDGPDQTAVVLDQDGVRIVAFSIGALGGVESVGYRFDYRGRSVVVAGHERRHPNVARFAAGADVLVHEAANERMIDRGIQVMRDVGQRRLASLTHEMRYGYVTPVEAAEIARDAGVGQLVLTRLYPPPSTLFERLVFMYGVRSVFPNTVLGYDGLRIRLDPRF
jgi:ribonuclease Z